MDIRGHFWHLFGPIRRAVTWGQKKVLLSHLKICKWLLIMSEYIDACAQQYWLVENENIPRAVLLNHLVLCVWQVPHLDINWWTILKCRSLFIKSYFRSRRWGSSLPGLRTQDPPLSPPGLFWGGRGGPQNDFFIGILLFLLLRSPCKNVKPYDNPFCGFE